MKKQLIMISALLFLLLVIQAEARQNSDEFSYSFVTDGAVINAFNGNSQIAHIPSVIGGEPVVAIREETFLGHSSLTQAYIPDSVTEIGRAAFWSCSGLESILLPQQLISIKGGTFWSCSSLAGIAIPDSVTQIESGAFAYCSELTDVQMPRGLASIGNNAFQDCCSLSVVALPPGTVSIGEQAFYNCPALEKIFVPETVTSIGEQAFYGDTGIVGEDFYGSTILTIYGKIGSYAQQYANANEIPFIGMLSVEVSASSLMAQPGETIQVTAAIPVEISEVDCAFTLYHNGMPAGTLTSSSESETATSFTPAESGIYFVTAAVAENEPGSLEGFGRSQAIVVSEVIQPPEPPVVEVIVNTQSAFVGETVICTANTEGLEGEVSWAFSLFRDSLPYHGLTIFPTSQSECFFTPSAPGIYFIRAVATGTGIPELQGVADSPSVTISDIVLRLSEGGRKLKSSAPFFLDEEIASFDPDGDDVNQIWEDIAMQLINPIFELDEEDNWLSNREAHRVVNICRVTPYPSRVNRQYLLFYYCVTWARDYGRFSLKDHNGDVEKTVLAWKIMGDDELQLKYVFTSSHDDSSQLCNHSAVWNAVGETTNTGKVFMGPDDTMTAALEFSNNNLKLQVSEDKHAIYPTAACGDDVQLFITFGEDCGGGGEFRFDCYNAGEPNRHLMDDIGHLFANERIWSGNTSMPGKFCGGLTPGDACPPWIGSNLSGRNGSLYDMINGDIGITFYQDHDGEGWSLTRTTEYNAMTLDDLGFPNDRLSSIRIGTRLDGEIKVTLYEHVGQTGDSREFFGTGFVNLGDYGFNDKCSSYKVEIIR